MKKNNQITKIVIIGSLVVLGVLAFLNHDNETVKTVINILIANL